jgi:hypothetical protein
MKLAMSPVTMMTRSSRVADIIWETSPTSRAVSPVDAATTAQVGSPLGPVLMNRPSANESRPTMRVKNGGRPDKPKNGNELVSGLLVAEDAFDDFGVLGRPGSEVPGCGVD